MSCARPPIGNRGITTAPNNPRIWAITKAAMAMAQIPEADSPECAVAAGTRPKEANEQDDVSGLGECECRLIDPVPSTAIAGRSQAKLILDDKSHDPYGGSGRANDGGCTSCQLVTQPDSRVICLRNPPRARMIVRWLIGRAVRSLSAERGRSAVGAYRERSLRCSMRAVHGG